MIYTIGHSNHPWEFFIMLLQQYRIQTLVDIRYLPYSGYCPQYNQNFLESQFKNYQIAYQHLPQLGGKKESGLIDSPNTFWQQKWFRYYADHMLSEEFQQSISKLIQLSQKQKIAIMCAEKKPEECHRSLTSDFLTAQQIEVVHIIPEGIKAHILHPQAKINDGKVTYPAKLPDHIQRTLF